MKLELVMADEFGAHLADGALAAEFRTGRIEPYLELCREIVVDFSGVRSANSSFVNALIAGLIEQEGEKVLSVLTFKGCNPVIRVLIESAIELGISKTRGRIDA